MSPPGTTESALLGGGCFWCLDAVFRELAGVVSVESGYAGGRVANPTYEDVCGGRTGHAEVVRVTFDSEPSHSIEQQRDGWQAILDNFARHVQMKQDRAGKTVVDK